MHRGQRPTHGPLGLGRRRLRPAARLPRLEDLDGEAPVPGGVERPRRAQRDGVGRRSFRGGRGERRGRFCFLPRAGQDAFHVVRHQAVDAGLRQRHRHARLAPGNDFHAELERLRFARLPRQPEQQRQVDAAVPVAALEAKAVRLVEQRAVEDHRAVPLVRHAQRFYARVPLELVEVRAHARGVLDAVPVALGPPELAVHDEAARLPARVAGVGRDPEIDVDGRGVGVHGDARVLWLRVVLVGPGRLQVQVADDVRQGHPQLLDDLEQHFGAEAVVEVRAQIARLRVEPDRRVEAPLVELLQGLVREEAVGIKGRRAVGPRVREV